MSELEKKKVKKAKKKSKEEKKINRLLPVVRQEMSLVVVEKKDYSIVPIYQHELFKETVKKFTMAMAVTILISNVVLLIIIATSIFYVSHLQNGLIQKGVYISGINVSNLNSSEAVSSVTAELNGAIPEVMNLVYKENAYPLNLHELGVQFDVETAVDEAYSIGRTKNIVKDLNDYIDVMNSTVNIDSNLQYNEDALNQYIAALSAELPDKVQEYTYEVQGVQLIINRGKNGVALNQEELKNIILSNLNERNYEAVELPMIETYPKEIDVAAIHDAVYQAPQDAFTSDNPFAVHEQIIGVDFDMEAVQNMINSEKQEQYIMDLTLTNPNIFVKDLSIFNDILSTFSTGYVNNPNRTTNLIIAANKISGTVVMPGETFSFNRVVGERTIAAGYRNAAIFVNGQVEDGLAGGICQVSSTLYNSVVGANLEIVERHNHSKLTSYLPGGKDATVAWGRYDFQFKNNREYPVKVEMSVGGGTVTANICGIKTADEYDIKIQSASSGGGYYNAYKVYYQNGAEVRREFLSRDYYR